MRQGGLRGPLKTPRPRLQACPLPLLSRVSSIYVEEGGLRLPHAAGGKVTQTAGDFTRDDGTWTGKGSGKDG